MTHRVYAGIGSRSTPADVLDMMRRLAGVLGRDGWTLRSGGARGADQAFMAGCEEAGRAEIYLPWSRYEGISEFELERPTAAAFEIAASHHPAWHSCGRGARALHARNAHQILGADLDGPVSFIACWTPDGSLDGLGRHSGGTGQALRIGVSHEVPVVNLARPEHRSRVGAFLGSKRWQSTA